MLLVLGCRLNVRQISYNFAAFAREAKKVMVDVDAAELAKPTIAIDLPVHADVKDFLAVLLEELGGYDPPPAHAAYVAWGQQRRRNIPPCCPTIGTPRDGEPLLLRRDIVRRVGRG